MNKYEIMILVDGGLPEKEANDLNVLLQKKLKDVKHFTQKNMGLLKMAYKIKGKSDAYYFVYNFETDQPKIIKEFSQDLLINKKILRHLVMNIEKNYGYKASINPKKIKQAKIKEKIFLEKQKKNEALYANKKNEMYETINNEKSPIEYKEK